MKKLLFVLTIITMLIVPTCLFGQNGNPFVGTWALIFHSKPLVFEIEFNEKYCTVLGRYIYSAKIDKIDYIVLPEDLTPGPYTDNGESVSFLNFDFEYLADPRGNQIFLFVDGQVVAELKKKEFDRG